MPSIEFFPLGQVTEGFLGFDSSAHSTNDWLWRHLGFPFGFFPPFGGRHLQEMAREMERFLEIHLDHIPQLKANLLFQYKRPEYITLSSGKEWDNWKVPYYRYDIYQEQQNLLSHLHTHFANEVLILYASPAIHKVDDLVNLFQSRLIIENSNFTKAVDLNNHHRNTYTNGGNQSIACSEPEKFDTINLLATIENFQPENIERANDNAQFIINFRKRLLGIIGETEYGNLMKVLNQPYEGLSKYPIFYSFLTMANFKTLTGIQWLIKIDRPNS